MEKYFYPVRGRKAWPDGCPCCGEPVNGYEPEDDENFALWVFGCGAEIYFDGELPRVDEDCPEAMEQHMEGIIISTPEPVTP